MEPDCGVAEGEAQSLLELVLCGGGWDWSPGGSRDIVYPLVSEAVPRGSSSQPVGRALGFSAEWLRILELVSACWWVGSGPGE